MEVRIMFCRFCGSQLDDDAVFCSQCGKKLDAPDEPDAVLPDDIDVPPDLDQGTFEEVKAVLPDETVQAHEDEDDDNDNDMPEAIFADSYDTVAAIDEALEALGVTSEEAPAEEPHDIPLPEPEPAPEPEPQPMPMPEPVPEIVPEPEPQPQPEPVPVPVPPLVKAPRREEPLQEVPTPQPEPVYNSYDNGQQQPFYIEQDRVNNPSPAYVPPEQSDFVQAEQPRKVGAVRLTGAWLIAVAAFISLLTLSVMFAVKLGISGDILEKRTRSMDINTVLDADYNGKSLSDAIYNETGFGEASHGKVSKSEFRTYLSKTDLLKYAGGYIKDYTDYILIGGMSDPSLTNNDLADFFASNSDIANDVFEYEMKVADYNRVRSVLAEKDTAKNFSLAKFEDSINFRLENISFIFSYVTLGIIGGLVFVLLIWIIVAVDKRGKHVVGLYGSIFSWSGVFMAVIGLAAVAGTSIAHVITGDFIFYLCAALLLPFGVFALCIGAGELFIGFIFKRIRRGIRNKEKRNKAVEKALAETYA